MIRKSYVAEQIKMIPRENRKGAPTEILAKELQRAGTVPERVVQNDEARVANEKDKDRWTAADTARLLICCAFVVASVVPGWAIVTYPWWTLLVVTQLNILLVAYWIIILAFPVATLDLRQDHHGFDLDTFPEQIGMLFFFVVLWVDVLYVFCVVSLLLYLYFISLTNIKK